MSILITRLKILRSLLDKRCAKRSEINQEFGDLVMPWFRWMKKRQWDLANAEGTEKELALVDHQVKELEDAKLVVGEDEQLERDYAAAGHGRRILELAGAAASCF